MKKDKINYRIASFLLMASLATTTISCSDDDNNSNNTVEAPNVNFTALTNNNVIVKYNARNLTSPISTTPITGLAGSEQIVSIDYRPATGQLYALGSSSRLYFINEESGAATALGTASFSPATSGTNASLDFNPTVDRIRLVTASGQNLRLHPELGTVVATDIAIAGNANTRIGAVAYTNSMAGASSTTLYDIDFGEDKLYIQNPPNDGGLQLVGDLTIDFEGQGDFDILADNSQALAVTNNNSISKLYTIDLTNGKAVDVGTFGLQVISLAFKTNPVAFATTADNLLYRFNPTSPMINSVALAGLSSGETVVGLDFRPATGTLYAITNQSRLLTVNTANGQLTQVGTSLTPSLSGTSFGFDFNPTVDRIRLVSDTGQNLRLHPDLGTVVFTDGNLNPGTPVVNAGAYTNNFAGSTTTALFVIDTSTDMLYLQNPPNNGTLVSVGSLGFNVETANGFDIGGSSNAAFALFRVNGVTSVYAINLTTGAATKGADINIQATAMAVGLGF
ncbi:DUF4394 domain-containing protein [Flavobacterium sp.]|uniref:DUF4394 domain-containing protein n=1 Tax=Flavobacterium sp. TaxID=239 RepID=UPI00391A4940